jgi:hypothetical protein
MIRRDVVSKLSKLMKRLEAEKGPFTLFGVFRREGAFPDDLDLVVAAPWFPADDMQALDKFIEEVRAEFGDDLALFTIMPVDYDSPFFQIVLDNVGNVQRRPVERAGCELFDLPLREAYIFKLRRPRKAA